MKLKNLQIIELRNALQQIDAFKFSALIRYSLAKNLRRLSETVADLNIVHKKMGEERKMWRFDEKGAKITDSAEVLNDFKLEWNKLMEVETEIVLTPITLKDLDLENNAIPITTISFIDCIIIEEKK